MRILIATPCYNVLDGVSLTVRKLEEEILAAGHSVCILTTASGNSNNTNMDGIHPNRRVIFLQNSVIVPFGSDPASPDLHYHVGLSVSKSTLDEITKFAPTLVHLTVPDLTSLYLIQWARRSQIPLMGTYHSNYTEYVTHYGGFSFLKIMLGDALLHDYNFLQRLYVPTPFIKDYLTKEYGMDRVTDLNIWGRGANLQRFHPKHRSDTFRSQQLGVDQNTVVVCWVGRFVKEKRPDIFAYCIQELYRLGMNFHAVVIGAGACEGQLAGLPKTTYLGWLNPEELKTAYASSDIFLFPSAVETFGNATLEAAASGLPLVVERQCAGHLVNHGVNGIACSEDDADAFLKGTISLIQNKELRESFSHESRRHALKFEQRVVFQQMLDNYEEVTDEFYGLYGGRHENRDEIHRKQEGSFPLGSFPIPSLVLVLLWSFVLAFRFLWYVVVGVLWLQRIWRNMRGQKSNVLEVSPTVHPVLKKNNSRSDVATFSRSKKRSIVSQCSHILARVVMACLRFHGRLESRLQDAAVRVVSKLRKTLVGSESGGSKSKLQ